MDRIARRLVRPCAIGFALACAVLTGCGGGGEDVAASNASADDAAVERKPVTSSTLSVSSSTPTASITTKN